jgi:hypothetical protein
VTVAGSRPPPLVGDAGDEQERREVDRAGVERRCDDPDDEDERDQRHCVADDSTDSRIVFSCIMTLGACR